MANQVYTKGFRKCLNGTVDLLNDTLKIMLVTSSYTFDPDDEFVDEGGADDPSDHEIDLAAAGYVKGWGNSGRHAISSPTLTDDLTNDEVEFDAADPSTWTSIGPGAVIDAAILIKEGGANDTTSILIAYYDTTSGTPSLPYTTNGGNFTLNINTEGLFKADCSPA